MRTEEMRRVAAVLDDVAGEARPLAGGFTHETFLMTLRESTVVVRIGGKRHDIESAVMRQARRHVPVPRVRAVLPPSSTTRSMMVLDYVPGTLLADLLTSDTPDLTGLGAEVGRAIARIGTVRFRQPGFFADAQLVTSTQPPWSRQLPGFADTCMAEPAAAQRLDSASRREWTALCVAHSAALTEVDSHARLVHADANPKNILVGRSGDRWRVEAVLDWEFSFSGSPYTDAGNMLRFAADYPPQYIAGFHAGFGAQQDADWLYLGRVMDMFALSELVTRPAGHQIADRAAERIGEIVVAGQP